MSTRKHSQADASIAFHHTWPLWQGESLMHKPGMLLAKDRVACKCDASNNKNGMRMSDRRRIRCGTTHTHVIFSRRRRCGEAEKN